MSSLATFPLLCFADAFAFQGLPDPWSWPKRSRRSLLSRYLLFRVPVAVKDLADWCAKTTAKPSAKKAQAKKAEKPTTKTATKKTAAPKKTAAKPKANTAKPRKASASTVRCPHTPCCKTWLTPEEAPAVVDQPKVLGKTKSGRVTKTPVKSSAKKGVPKKKASEKKSATPKKTET